MPHSSGGGSHSGGSHRGSSSRKRYTIKNNYFQGAHRFYTYKNSKLEYIYADKDITKEKTKTDFRLIFLFLPLVIALLIAVSDIWHEPKPIITDYKDTEISVIDDLHIIKDKDALLESLKEFYEKTGITPCIATKANKTWQTEYDSLEKYAYDLYLDLFKDEKHWLIVYTQQEDIKEGEYVDWFFEGMQGNYTDSVLTQKMARRFTDNMQKNLTDKDSYTLEKAIKAGFDDLNEVIIEPYISKDNLRDAISYAATILLFLYFLVFYDPYKKYRDYKECSIDAKEAKCRYCGKVYLNDGCTECPLCKAPVQPSVTR